MGDAQFLVEQHAANGYPIVSSTRIFTVPVVQRLTIVPINQGQGNDAGRTLNSQTRFGDTRETDDILLKSFKIKGTLALQPKYYSQQTALNSAVTRVRYTFVVVKTDVAFGTIQADAHHFIVPPQQGVQTLRTRLPQRYKEYKIIKRITGLLRSRPSIFYRDENNHIDEAIAPEVFREVNLYHKFKKPIKFKYTNQGGDQMVGANYFVLYGCWDESAVTALAIDNNSHTDLRLSGAISVFYTDRD